MPTQPYKDRNGKRVPGVTTVIGGNLGWNKGALMYWAWNEGVNGRNFRDTSQKAADIGTIAHAMVEAELKGKDWKKIVDLRNVTDEMIDKAENAYLAWLEWARTVNFTLVQSELSLVHDEMGYGGTIDIAAIKNETCIVDLKTSNSVYPDHKIQLAAYGELYNYNFPEDPITAYYLLKLGKDDGSFAYYYWPNLNNAFRAFKALLELHNLKKVV